MPKAPKNILDRLNKILKTRENALNRFDRRFEPFFNNKVDFHTAVKVRSEARDLVDNLGDAALIEYDKVLRSSPDRETRMKAYRSMPMDLLHDYEYRY